MDPGTRIGSYEIVAALGAGGMGEVYRATDTRLERDVALKVLPPEMASSQERLERFRREARALAALDHPGIVTVFSVEEADGIPFLTMQLVEGQPLSALIPEAGMPVERILRIATGLTDALAVAHDRGIVHRDLKPANVMLTADGRVKILDFGLAKMRATEAGARSEAATEMATREGVVMGTVPYMSPEQVAGRPVDSRSDLFSLGVLLYEMATGRRPFAGESSAELMSAILRDQPERVTELRRDLPAALKTVIERCLAKDPADRFESAREIRALMQSAATDPATAVSDAAAIAASKRSRALELGVAAVLLLAVLGWWASGWRGTGVDEGAAETGGPAAMRAGTSSIAVLPFADLSDEDGTSYLGDGVAETISTALSKVPGLTVTARTSAFALRDEALDMRSIGLRLGVGHVLTGSIQRAGDQVRIAARVVRADDESILWSDVFDRPAADIFAVQDEVARAAAAALELRLGSRAEAMAHLGGTDDPEAYDAYLLGRYHWNRRNTEGMIEATAAFKRAIELDPDYALAWAGLADAYSLSIPGEYNVPGMEADVALPLAEEAARRAIALAPELGEAYASLGEALANGSGRHDEAMEALERAVAMSPSYATAHQWYSYELQAVNRWGEGIREMEIAHRLDPLAHVITLSLAIAYDGMDRFEDASPLYEQGLAQAPDAWYAWAPFFSHQLALGRYDEAAVALRTSLNGPAYASEGDRSAMIRLAELWRDPATRDEATDLILRQGEPIPALALARWTYGHEAAIEQFETMVRDGRARTVLDPWVFHFVLGPALRAEPSVQASLLELGGVPFAQ